MADLASVAVCSRCTRVLTTCPWAYSTASGPVQLGTFVVPPNLAAVGSLTQGSCCALLATGPRRHDRLGTALQWSPHGCGRSGPGTGPATRLGIANGRWAGR